MIALHWFDRKSNRPSPVARTIVSIERVVVELTVGQIGVGKSLEITLVDDLGLWKITGIARTGDDGQGGDGTEYEHANEIRSRGILPVKHGLPVSRLDGNSGRRGRRRGVAGD